MAATRSPRVPNSERILDDTCSKVGTHADIQRWAARRRAPVRQDDAGFLDRGKASWSGH